MKPSNFAMGNPPHNKHIVRNGRHIPYLESLVGTAPYASMATHLGIRQSRRDDIESLGYTLMRFLRGSLPWQEVNIYSKKEEFQLMLERKQRLTPILLCRGYPNEFRDYFIYCSSLSFIGRPDYKYLKKLFRDLFERQGYQYDYVFDWDLLAEEVTANNGRASGGNHRDANKIKMQDPVVRINCALCNHPEANLTKNRNRKLSEPHLPAMRLSGLPNNRSNLGEILYVDVDNLQAMG